MPVENLALAPAPALDTQHPAPGSVTRYPGPDTRHPVRNSRPPVRDYPDTSSVFVSNRSRKIQTRLSRFSTFPFDQFAKSRNKVSISDHGKMTTGGCFCILPLLLLAWIGVAIGNDELTLKMVQAVFRHGDRTPEPKAAEFYPTDPYKDFDFYPVGLGGLTNAGKTRSYALGQFLRQRYDTFLGQIYKPKAVYARSTNIGRTKMSLLLVLAGLYPPSGVQRWNNDLNWQPIPYTAPATSDDGLLHPFSCTTFPAAYSALLETDSVRASVTEYADLMANLTQHTGKTFTALHDIAGLYWTLRNELEFGLSIPDWAREYYPDRLTSATAMQFKLLSRSVPIRKNTGAYLIREFVRNVRDRFTTRRMLRINLYSGHDVNIHSLMYTLGFHDPFIPEYSSALIFEAYSRNNTILIKTLHYLGIPPELRELTIPGCETLCPLSQFRTLMDQALSNGDARNCIL